jgi:hypothetical protein
MVTISDDSDGTVRVMLRFSDGATAIYRCAFQWFLKWRQEVGDAKAIQVMGSRRLDVWEDGGAIVNMQTFRRVGSGGAVRRRTVPEPPRNDRGQVDDDLCVGKARGDLEEVEILLDVELPWLFKKEREMLQSFIHQLRHGHALSPRQESFLETLRDRSDRRRRPKFYRG